MEVIDTMKTGGQSAGALAAVFDDYYLLACDFLSLVVNTVIGKRTWLRMNKLG